MKVSRQYRGGPEGTVVKRHEPGSPYSGKFMLRIPPALHEKLAKIADRERRSLNLQVEVMLEEAAKEWGKR